MLSWLERKAAATLFATPPTSTAGEALTHFLEVMSCQINLIHYFVRIRTLNLYSVIYHWAFFECGIIFIVDKLKICNIMASGLTMLIYSLHVVWIFLISVVYI